MSAEREIHDITPSLILQIVRRHYRSIGLVAVLVGVVTFLAMLCVPRYYRSDYTVMVEMYTTNITKSLHMVGVALGYDLGDVPTVTDAILFDMYGDLLHSREFLAGIMRVQVTEEDGRRVSYYEHLLAHPQRTMLQDATYYVGRLLGLRQEPSRDIDPMHLTPEQDEIFDAAASRFFCLPNIDKRCVIISVRDCDPMVCATLADSLRQHIQQFVMEYRVQKAQQSVAYYEELLAQSDAEYQHAMDAYGQYANAHSGVTQPSAATKVEVLQREVAEKAAIREAVRAHHFAEAAREQDRTPLFVPVQRSAVPCKPDGPRRMFNALMAAFAAFNVMVLWYMRRDIIGQLTR